MPLLSRPYRIAIGCLGLLVWLPLVSTPLAAELSPKAIKILEEGEAALSAGDFTVAIRHFKKADKLVKKADKLAPEIRCALGLAMAYNRTGEFDKAEGFARQAVTLATRPDEHAYAYNELGISLFSSRRREEREGVPSVHHDLFGLGNSDIRLTVMAADDRARLEEAVGAFHKVLEVIPRSGAIRYNLVEALLTLGRDEEGIA